MIYWKVYRLTPPRRYGEGAKLIDDSVTITTSAESAIEAFRRQILDCEEGGLTNKSGTDCVYLSVQKSPDPAGRGKIIYRSNMGGKVGRSRISAIDRRILLPATREYAKLVASTWPWHPRFISGVEELVQSGDITREQAEIALSSVTESELREAARAIELKEKKARAAAKKNQASEFSTASERVPASSDFFAFG